MNKITPTYNYISTHPSNKNTQSICLKKGSNNLYTDTLSLSNHSLQKLDSESSERAFISSLISSVWTHTYHLLLCQMSQIPMHTLPYKYHTHIPTLTNISSLPPPTFQPKFKSTHTTSRFKTLLTGLLYSSYTHLSFSFFFSH